MAGNESKTESTPAVTPWRKKLKPKAEKGKLTAQESTQLQQTFIKYQFLIREQDFPLWKSA